MSKVYHVMYMDIPVADVITEDDNIVVSITKFVEDSPMQPFCGITENSSRPAMTKRFYDFLKDRCYEDGRGNLKEILDAAGLSSNNPFEWVKVCHGVTWEDYFWVKFDDEDICFEDVKIR